MAEHDLTSRLVKYLDRHLVFPLLEFLSHKGTYPEDDIQKSKLALLQQTNMVDYSMDIYKALYNKEDVPEEMKARRHQVVQNLKNLQAQVESVVTFLSNESSVKQLRQDKAYNTQLLQENYQIGAPQIEALYLFAKFQFDCGSYSEAAETLFHCRTLSTNPERNLSALWGILAAHILTLDWEAALEDLMKLKDIIDSNTFTPVLTQLQQRTWLMHWSLFVFFNHENGRNAIIDLFLQERYLNALQTQAQHLLRYLAAAVVVNKRRRGAMKELMRCIEQEAHEYSDPITQFLDCLFVQYDFEGAQRHLAVCEQVLDDDYFLTSIREEFVDCARLFIFESYCKIHQCIDMSMLAEKLNMDNEDAEKWIVNLIKQARMDAKIDSSAGTVLMGTHFPSAFEQLAEKAQQLSGRTFHVASLLQPARA